MKKILIFVFLIVAVTLSGCTINFGSKKTTKGPDGGIFKSTTSGSTWAQKSLIATTSGKPGQFNESGSTVLAMDPSDTKALYYASSEGGVYYTYDSAESWREIPALKGTLVIAFAVDPSSKCVLYAATDNKLLKSSDCGRSWIQTYYDNDVKVKINVVAIDHYDSTIVYIGTSRGEIIQSLDSGKSWQTMNRFENDLKKILIGPADSRILFVATESAGLFRSLDKGVTWISLKENLKEFPDSKKYRDLFVSTSQPGFVMMATKYGLIKSINNGDDWTALKLITPESEATINSVITHPQNPQEIYYITNTTFYGSTDGGENWATKKLPSSRPGQQLLSDPKSPTTVYLTFKQVKK
ncbi:hypothetical protein IPN41_02695 [Candidatus Falkowbacteria bacterium]|nr:MAG: hypothetical protein IPN41_02695 [Candidatus Falkowbacteria bacterium]